MACSRPTSRTEGAPTLGPQTPEDEHVDDEASGPSREGTSISSDMYDVEPVLLDLLYRKGPLSKEDLAADV